MNWRRLLLLILLASLAIAADAPPSTTAGEVTLTPEIVDRIKSVTGFGDDFPIVSARRVTAVQANTRQLAIYLKDETGIEVTLRPGRLKPRAGFGEDKYERRFTLYLNADGSQFMAIKSTLPGRKPLIPSDLPPDSAEVKPRPNYRVYQSFPTVIPKVNFLRALERAQVGYPLFAEEIEGLYIMDFADSAGSGALQPMWMITLRGAIAPASSGVAFALSGGGRPTESTFDVLNAIDATTGKWRFAGTIFVLRTPP